ncbi:intein C-terminal splicing region/RHS repeat-associated core domain-containing protein [Glycomyces sambucus]|uniref:Intein C-terminal splicing region/RHS repeat-associated core domain-containing protein n=1 Tax=Glycomyces sambucus TaxID=380244 RepID=A0A1G9KQQ2_9ACTN|nr:RHS repeat-associated core domain-containing protein [Glycomyces sambucus]SDL51936.1 intein C-terminal splicing region/RHS repeat-associated core domain-containing protein [Glycomyces sambucus]
MDDAPRTPSPSKPLDRHVRPRSTAAPALEMPWRPSTKTLVKRGIVFGAIAALVTGFLMWVGIWEPDYRPEAIDQESSVPGSDFEPDDVELPEDDTQGLALEGDQSVAFPDLSSAEVELQSGETVEIESLGVALAPAGEHPPASVAIALRDASATDGLHWDIERTDGSGEAGAVAVTFDYSGYRNAGGADWDDRLKLYGADGTEIPATHNAVDGTLTAQIPLAPGRSGGGYAPLATTADDAGHAQTGTASASVTMAASASGDNGTFAATSLAPSSTWSAGNPTGDFAWSYPIDTPSSAGGLDPSIAFAYSSSAVDGRNESTNNQPSTIGEGFSFDPGYIERNYTACQMDDEDGANNPPEAETGGDQCWRTDNAVLSLNGSGGELVRDDDTGTWKIKNDDASKVEKLSGANNGDDNGEYWKVTTGAGIQYFFGLNRLPGFGTGDAETESTSTVPVFGNHDDEPCNATAFEDSSCQQAWRWRLDWVVDTHGNAMAYFYDGETNHYLRNLDEDDPVEYDRGANLSRVHYGLRSADAYAQATNRVVFDFADRCLADAACDYDHPENWPDVPLDQYCDGTAGDCEGIYSPTFFTDQRLSSVTTQVYTGGTWKGVDQWSLAQSWPDPGDSTRAGLWLDGITRTGLAGAEPIALPEITFDGVQLYNRVQKTLDTKAPMNWFRISAIRNGTGGVTTVNYTDTDCDAKTGDMPSSPEDNDRLCMPVVTTLAEDNDGVTEYDWYHKYLVTEVAEIDTTGGSPPVTTAYEYVGTPAWRFTDDDGLTDPDYKTWSMYRGYSKVRTITGDGSDEKLVTETSYFRGLDGQKLPDGTTTSVTVDGVTDHDEFAGRPRTETTLLDGEVLSERTHTPWRSSPTATRVRDWGTVYARHTGTSRVEETALLSDGSSRTVATETHYDAWGMVKSTDSLGDVAVEGDEKCTTVTYARNQTAWLVRFPVRTETVSVDCDTDPSYPDDLISDERVYYDYATAHTTAPTKGDITKTETADSYVGGAPQYLTTGSITVDGYGRGVTSTDVDGNVTTTAYTPATGGPVTEILTTNALDHTSRQILDPLRGDVLQSFDANDNMTEMEYDALGRIVAGWTPDRTRADDYDPAAEFEYLISDDEASATITRGINANNTYTTTIELFDGLMRSRQTQIPAPDGGRILSDTVYDTRGLVHKQYSAYYNEDPPSTDQFEASDNDIPGMTVYEYDSAGRVTAEVFSSHGIEQYRTTKVYDGEAVTAIDADGRAATSITDAAGNIVEVRNLDTTDPAGAHDSIFYEYDHADRLVSMTDPGGSEWTYEYDLLGRQTAMNDPDTGRTETTYFDNGLVESTTDERDESIWYEYDELGRVIYVMRDDFYGDLLEAYEYDLFGDGLPATTSSWDEDGNLYKTRVLGYDDASRPVGIRYTLDGDFGGLDRSFDFRYTYNRDGSVAQVTYPSAGGLAAEEVVTTYSDLGLPQTTYSPRQWYVSDSTYTKFAEIAQLTMDPDGPNVADAPVAWQAYTYEDGTRRVSGSSFEISTGPDHLISDLSYGYTDGGMVTSVDNQSDLGADTQCFAYDYLKRITDAWTGSAPAACESEPTDTDAVGGAAPYWQSWTFDEDGNRDTQVDHLAGETIDYTYDLAQPHTLTSSTITDDTGVKTLSYAYDGTGNTVSRPDANGTLQSLTWSVDGKLESTETTGDVTDYDYTADGSRISRTDPDGTMTVFLPGMEVVKAPDGSLSASRYYAHGAQQVAVRTNDDNLTWVGADHQGTSTAMVDADTHAVQVRYFDPYGNERGSPVATWVDEHTFLGATEDPSGLVQLGARSYDSHLGRFISADPVLVASDSQQMGGYAYANHSPVTFSDPTGACYEGWNYNYDPCAGEHYGSPGYGKGYGGTPGQATGGCYAGQCDAEVGDDAPSEDEVNDAQDVMNTSIVDVVIDVGAEILLDLIGVNDIMSCVGAGDMWACASLLMDLIPWAKAAKMAGKLFKAAKKIYNAVTSFQEKLDAAMSTLRRYDDAMQAAIDRAKKKFGFTSSDAPSCPIGNSFTDDTEVVMADGSAKAIADVEAGDEVLATDEITGETSAREVAATIEGTGERDLVAISVDTDGDTVTDDTITATDGHPIWVADPATTTQAILAHSNGDDTASTPTDPSESDGLTGAGAGGPPAITDTLPGQWVDAIDLKIGQLLRTSTGTWIQVTALETRTEFTTVYNLTVADLHTFSVTAADTDFLTHNCGDDALDAAQQAANEASSIRPSGARPAVAEGLQVPGGSVYSSTSIRGSLVRVHPAVQAVLNTVPPGSRGAGHGQCGLVVCLSQALFNGESPVGGSAAAVLIRSSTDNPKHGHGIGPCGSCEALVEHFDLSFLTGKK